MTSRHLNPFNEREREREREREQERWRIINPSNKGKEERRKEVKKNPRNEQILSVQVRKRIHEEFFY